NGDEDAGYTGFANLQTKAYDNAGLAVADMVNGKVKYVAIDAAVAKALAEKIDKIKVIDFALTKEDFGIGVDKNQAELLASINAFLASHKAEIAALYDKYQNITDDNAASWSGSTITAGTYDASKNQFVIATNAAFAPYEFKVGDKFAGIDMELAKMIADELGMELVIQDMEFDAVVTSIGKNGVDAAFSGLTITPARQKVINFSTPYEEGSYQVIIAMKDDTTFDACKSAEDVLKVLGELK
ncbi:MAG: transporter substrate-binding domain-containing protein, partial [Clostridia bacterium]|nr:transporter substrate-binding domain-containing protein [Clostridia bacterium]